jgi:DNA-binding MarR family transcriptional regulator
MPVPERSTGASLTQRIHRAATAIRRRVEHEILQPARLTFTSYEILHTLLLHGACTPAEIVRVTGIRAPTVSEASARLVADRLIARRPDARDARSYRLQLTASGRRLAGRLASAVDTVQAQVLGGLDEAALAGAEALLTHLQPDPAEPPAG